MNELKVVIEQKQGIVTSNFDEIKNQLYLAVDEYKGLVYTEETVNQAKTDIATLRKVKKAIEDKRKEVKKAQMIPYEEFEKNVKELVQIIDSVIDPINVQLVEFEDKRKADRKAGIEIYFNSLTEGIEEYVSFYDVFDEKMLNASTTQKAIKDTIVNFVESAKKDISTIKSMNSEVEEKALKKYAETKQLSDAVNMITDYERQKAEIIARREQEEKERKEREERERLAEIEREKARAAEEEQKRIQEEIEKAKREERIRIEQEMAKKAEAERIERERLEKERLAKEEAERIKREQEEKIAREKEEKERLAREEEERKRREEIAKAREEEEKNFKETVISVKCLTYADFKQLEEFLADNDCFEFWVEKEK